MTTTRRILVVDDEPQITRVLRLSLQTHGYEVRVAADGEAALDVVNDWGPELVITDLSMPNLDGIELCRRLRERSGIPIIVLSARGEERSKVGALDAGADDYISKPFGIDELLARIRAALRRAAQPPVSTERQSVIEVGDFRIDLETRLVTLGSREIHLTPKEFDLFLHLARNSGKVLTHRNLLAAVWGGDYVEQTEYLRVFVGNLRKKIELDSANPVYILTEPWVGYRFNPGK